MDDRTPRQVLERLISAKGDSYGAISKMIGRNPAYIQQFIKRGTPRKLDEADRHILARYFGVDEASLMEGFKEKSYNNPVKRPPPTALAVVQRLSIGASAGGGALNVDEHSSGAIAFDPKWLRSFGVSADNLSIIQVSGESMAPTLTDGDDIMVNRADGTDRLRDGIYVLRLDGALMVKRVAVMPRQKGRALSISSDNPHYPNWPDIDPALIDIVGRVVWAGRRMN
ncbi:S24 family peptidase [Sphingobium subterraneum]|uniref:Phage repressor protein C with HTH and peptisase S24 domain n=1 Tax=Sphingobium subterraneum TaxID=627688 RepID=A0A841J477_9SPHN|nr:S24 family peptidase [Sphingobium subterraneum]MBB6123328.1 phage repressor protein C with HTH and peptisase S24 domain [Sphingobium subterraneum]